MNRLRTRRLGTRLFACAAALVVVGSGLPATSAWFAADSTASGTVTTDTLSAIAPTSTLASETRISLEWGAAPQRGAAPVYTLTRSGGGAPTPVVVYSGAETTALDLGADPAGSTIGTISTGNDHTCAIASGVASCWGSNAHGQLGDGTTASSSRPRPVAGLPTPVTAIDAGDFFTCAIAADAVYCWGYNGNGQLGPLGPDSAVPVPIAGMTGSPTAVSAGGGQACAISGGDVYCWGSNSYGQAGRPSLASDPVARSVAGLPRAVAVVSAGARHTCAIADDAVYCWGDNEYGELGTGSVGGMTSHPQEVSRAGSLPRTVSAGLGFTCIVSATNGACWGRNDHGQLGDLTRISRATPALVTATTAPLRRIFAGDDFTCAIPFIRSERPVCWGAGEAGQLGDGERSDSLRARPVVDLVPPISLISTGAATACAMDARGVSCWGTNARGQIGHAEPDIADRPIAVPPVPPYTCPAGTVLGGTDCTLIPGTPYEYTLTYTIGGWDAPAGTVTVATAP